MKRMIFHHPLPLSPNAVSASGIRPVRMLEAFRLLGYEVEMVCGYTPERRRAIKSIKAKIAAGVNYDFVYSESSTMPTVLTDPHHLPLRPLMDYRFFHFCNKRDIPVGLFYRDIYWRFEEYGKGLNPIKAFVAQIAYRFDLWVYEKTLKKLYLPSLEMGAYVPHVNAYIFEALPPGHSSPNLENKERGSSQPIKMFYVGGMSDHYQMHKLFVVVGRFPNIELTICTRELEWQAVRHQYPALTNNIKVIHKTGNEMELFLKEADIALLFVKPQEYREFASPVKLYEYLGFQKPILVSRGTLAGSFVEENGIGWALDYEEHALHEFLASIQVRPEILTETREVMKKVSAEHSWIARAKQVAEGLKQ